MVILRKYLSLIMLLGLLSGLATACSSGGGSSNSGNNGAKVQLSGVAAAGAPVIGIVNVKGANGNVEHWICEATSPNMLVREGWDKSTLKPGDVITASGHRAKNGSPTLRLMKIVTADGTEHDHL